MTQQFITESTSYLGVFIFLFTWFITSFEPLQNKIDDLQFHLEDKYKTRIKFKKLFIVLKFLTDTIYEIISCHKCLAFWVTLIVTLNLPFAILVSFFADYNSRKHS